MTQQRICIGVIGGNEVDKANYDIAYELGTHIAGRGAVLICGGLGGIMEAVSKGVADSEGTAIGILPGSDKTSANPYVSIALPTGMGIARNTLVVQMADVLIAFPGSYGTLSEIAFALALGKTVVYLPGAWDLKKLAPVDAARFKEAFDARHAIGIALSAV
ncbi:MAG: TIGR00725 family protein [Chitinispirillaceae bacterium]|nr:TIGR00725 family protein [Chitinispirillaceae bacterium]